VKLLVFFIAVVRSAGAAAEKRDPKGRAGDGHVGVITLMASTGHSNIATAQRDIDLRPAVIKAAVELI